VTTLIFLSIQSSGNCLSIHRKVTPLNLKKKTHGANKSPIVIRDRRNPLSRRNWCKAQLLTSASVFTTGALLRNPVIAAETVGKDPDCSDSSCIGVWDGLLADCPHGFLGGAGCASSQDDTPGVFAEPWDYSEAPNNTMDWEEQMKQLIPGIKLVSSRRGDKTEILTQSGRYLRVLFVDSKTREESIGEFYFTPDDSTVQFRVGSLVSGNDFFSSSLKNLERCELIRKELSYLKIPVLRNRKRAFFFVESAFDSYGPGSASLPPPAEMQANEVEDKQNVDFLQVFPLKSK